MGQDLLLPSEIPFQRLKDCELEECVYWLLDAIGAKDLEWRIGGAGKGAADQGRDLQAKFHVPSPDGEIQTQKWWVEVKGRERTLEKAAVQEALLNAQGGDGVDVLVVATNSTFSNPTRDWVRAAVASRPRPEVRLWDRHTLERLVSKHPTVVLRCFANALSPQGKLEVVRSKQWNLAAFATPQVLRELWANRDRLVWASDSIFSVLVSEVANGDLAI